MASINPRRFNTSVNAQLRQNWWARRATRGRRSVHAPSRHVTQRPHKEHIALFTVNNKRGDTHECRLLFLSQARFTTSSRHWQVVRGCRLIGIYANRAEVRIDIKVVASSTLRVSIDIKECRLSR